MSENKTDTLDCFAKLAFTLKEKHTFATQAEALAFIFGGNFATDTDLRTSEAAVDEKNPETINFNFGDKYAADSYFASLDAYKVELVKLSPGILRTELQSHADAAVETMGDIFFDYDVAAGESDPRETAAGLIFEAMKDLLGTLGILVEGP